MMRRTGRGSAIRVVAVAVTDFTLQPSKGHIMSDTTNDAPVLDLLARMTADSLEASNLDVQTLMLVRIAALVAVNAPPVSYALNLEAAGETGLDSETVRGVLTAIAPIVGTARIAAATGNILRALAAKIELAEFEVAELEDDETDEE
jgi:alkylhydroperoxidase/carboxymuconolactone decarboxylase family protein YurZ